MEAADMNTTLNLVEHLLATARKHQELGRTHDALRILTRLTGFRELPGPVAEEALVRLAEIQLKRRKYNRARRHLIAALRHQPAEGRYHYLMGTACLAEGRGDLERATEHFRRALELEPTLVKCLLDFGLLAIRLGRTEEGLGHLRRAAELSPDDPVVIGKLARGLRQTGQSEEARAVLRAALFRNPRLPRFRRLWQDFQFQQLRQEQQKQRLDRQEQANDPDEPVLLPFVRLAHTDPAPQPPDGVRADGPATINGPHLPWTSRRSDQRHVQ
jgi:tetratricopeptide (TPR) repeat protein